MQTLWDDDRQVREHVAEALGRIAARSNPDLHAALEDADAFAQEQAPQMSQAIIPASASVLLQTLRNSDDFVLDSVIEALGRLGPAVVPSLLPMLQEPNGFVRAAAAEALGRIGDPFAVPALVRLLQDRHSFAWQCAANALARYGLPVVPALTEALRHRPGRKGAAMALGKIGEASVIPVLLKAMESADIAFAFDCSLAIAWIGPSARPYLLEALCDPYEFTRAAAAMGLERVGNSSDVPILLDALQDTGRFGRVRSCAAAALGKLKDPIAVPALLEATQDKHEAVRANAVLALGAFEVEAVLPTVIQALADPRLRVVQKALDVLEETDSAALSALERALLDSKEAIRVGAATALRRIYSDPDLPHRLLRRPDVTADRKGAALTALKQAHHPIPAPLVLCLDLMGNPDPDVRQSAEEVLLFLLRKA
jgi:HEAT repeat protein